MGNYNPHAPTILGEEWAPIRDEYTEVSTLQTSVEYGHQFTTTAAATLNDARFYVGEMPANCSDPFYLTSIYAAGTEADSGPIRSVIIPVDSVATTGAVTAAGSPPNGATALLTPVVDYYYSMSTQAVSPFGLLSIVWMRYDTAAYSQLLQGKRIIGVNVLLGLSAPLPLTPWLGITTDATTVDNVRVSNFANAVNNVSRVAFGGETIRFRLGNLAINNSTSLLTNEYLPWTYDDINKFDGSSASPNYVAISVGTYFGDDTGLSANLWYSAMEVLYCDEKRLYVAGWNSRLAGPINYGANVGRARSWPAKALSPSLAAGSYTMTIASLNTGDLTTDITDAPPQINACRELYSIHPHAGVQVNIPYPPEDNIGTTFTTEQTSILPQLSLHTSSAALTEPHVYGRQVAAQVWASRPVEQDIYNSFGAADSYPWARFYARRFGNTSYPLDFLGVGGSVGSGSITPDEFDALPEIVDGWKEVTLLLDTPATLGNNASDTYRWNANGETQANRWEILGCAAPALSGLPGNLFGQATQQLSNGTYYAPNGATYLLNWMPHGVANPYVSGAADDSPVDAVLMFALAPDTITGFGVEAGVQELVGIGLQCDVDPCGIASAVLYNRLTWPLPTGTGVSLDSFNRTETDTWGSSDSGLAYTEDGTATQYAVTPTDGGSIFPDGFSSNRFSVVESGGPDFDVTALIRITGTQTSSTSARAGVTARYTDGSNHYYAALRLFPTSATLIMEKRVAGAPSTLATLSLVPFFSQYYDGVQFHIRFQVQGSNLRAKVWPAFTEEPTAWMIQTSDTGLTTGNWAGAFVRTEAALDDIVYYYQELNINPPDYTFGSYEIQRMDAVTDWQTIMLASGVATTGFNDYEARVGLESTYRIRGVDLYGFYGNWSDEVSITLASPGATGGDCLSQGHLLLFTSNESQAGAYNLAYAPIWEGRVTEDFDFPESSFVQLQPMYDKDFFTAFRPTERGGVRFQRDILVQAAAIAPETLEDFTDLRDMAWADLSYVCVRDEEGNRWFATVAVPSGRVQLNRSLYMAVVDIVEVTDTPTQVNP